MLKPIAFKPIASSGFAPLPLNHSNASSRSTSTIRSRLEPDRCFQLLCIRHESAIATYRYHCTFEIDPVGGGHEARGLFVSREDEVDCRASQCVEQGWVLQLRPADAVARKPSPFARHIIASTEAASATLELLKETRKASRPLQQVAERMANHAG